jgi:hypothetical protein
MDIKCKIELLRGVIVVCLEVDVEELDVLGIASGKIDVEILDPSSGFVVCFSCNVMFNASRTEKRSRFLALNASLTFSNVSKLLH